MTYKKKIAELLQTPRVYWTALENENKVDGLLDLCKSYIKKSDLVVEVGCFSGVSSRVMALHCKSLHCVDPWSWDVVAKAEQMFDEILVDYPNITKVKLTSVDASNKYDNHSIDLVYIDADHTYQSVVEDIMAWKAKVKPGGYIAGHDFYMDDVARAVRDCLGEPLEVFSDSSWIIKL